MASYKLLVKPSAVKELEDLPRKDRKRVVARIHGLSAEPRPVGSEKLSGQDKFRVRQGNYRVLYSIDDTVQSVTVVKIAHPDKTQFDASDKHYDPSSNKDKPRWYLVDIRADEPLPKPVTLEAIKATPALNDMALVKAGRLSVQPVKPEEWDIIMKMAGAK